MNHLEAKLHNDLFSLKCNGYILGLERSPNSENKHVSHIYRGTFQEPLEPLCPKGYNRDKDGYSIWRNDIGLGICRVCLKNLIKEWKHSRNAPILAHTRYL